MSFLKSYQVIRRNYRSKKENLNDDAKIQADSHMQCWPIPQNTSSRDAFRSGRGTGFSVQTMKLAALKEKVLCCD